jgi:hypothetical protein
MRPVPGLIGLGTIHSTVSNDNHDDSRADQRAGLVANGRARGQVPLLAHYRLQSFEEHGPFARRKVCQ